eukprot:CAMPEP_0117438798 /NCGR_PEP_ID=MMETSP0759-20121206/2240_1 /TAXON_ID=63605 /ORGANISM="Percolomonas cosmopolitus, Strain WS" /LENGTH=448 /DNA_ID=CAMNT_0005230503 /DNA_START=194 /DNA_END=1540 /DNA_ORIENTATION=+
MDYFDSIIVDLYLEKHGVVHGGGMDQDGALDGKLPHVGSDIFGMERRRMDTNEVGMENSRGAQPDSQLNPQHVFEASTSSEASSYAIPASLLLSNLTDSLSIAHHQIFLRKSPSMDDDSAPPSHPVYYLKEKPKMIGLPTILNYTALGLYSLARNQDWTMSWWLNQEALVRVEFQGGFECEKKDPGEEDPSCLLSMAWIKGRQKYERYRDLRFENIVDYALEWTILDGDNKQLPSFELDTTEGEDEYFLVFSFHGSTRMDVQNVLFTKIVLSLKMYEIEDTNIYAKDYDTVSTPFLDANKNWKYVLIQDDPPEDLVEYKLSQNRVNMRFERSPRLIVGIPFVSVASFTILAVLLILFLYHKKIWMRSKRLSERMLISCRLIPSRRLSPDLLYMDAMADYSDDDDEQSTPSTVTTGESSILIRHSVPFDSRHIPTYQASSTHTTPAVRQ